jgi:hypothetical protein
MTIFIFLNKKIEAEKHFRRSSELEKECSGSILYHTNFVGISRLCPGRYINHIEIEEETDGRYTRPTMATTHH